MMLSIFCTIPIFKGLLKGFVFMQKENLTLRVATMSLESTVQTHSVLIGICYYSSTRMSWQEIWNAATIPRTKNSGKTLTSDSTTTMIVQSVYVRFGSSVLRLVNVQTNPLITMFQVTLRALLAFPSACRLYQDPTRCTLVSLVRLWQKKRFNEQLSLRTSNISEFIIVTLAKAIRYLMPFGGRITLDSSPSSLDLLICLMKKYFVYLSTGKKSVSSPVTIE